MLGSSLLPVVCMRAHVLLTLFVFFAHNGVQHTLCCVVLRLVYPMLLVSLDGLFFSNVYSS